MKKVNLDTAIIMGNTEAWVIHDPIGKVLNEILAKVSPL
ncbi:MAG: hypothetical protein H6Q68_742 [Firmicutes bacterium]|nr:hypothetical protein [Bacillota bacterium]